MSTLYFKSLKILDRVLAGVSIGVMQGRFDLLLKIPHNPISMFTYAIVYNFRLTDYTNSMSAYVANPQVDNTMVCKSLVKSLVKSLGKSLLSKCAVVIQH